jgi:hypothetical protein
MPPASASAASRQERLAAEVSEAKGQYRKLELAIASQSPRLPGRSGGKPGSRPPWNTAAAMLILEMQAGSRHEETRLKLLLGLPARHRGGSDANTLLALDAIVTLADAAGDEAAWPVLHWLGRWNGAAARALGEASAITELPRQPGEPARPCPFCGCLTLRFWALHGIVRCVNPDCRDDEGRRPWAKVEYSGFTQQLELVWMDGVAGLPPLPEGAAVAAPSPSL